jgi:hypothetical protein
MISESESDKKEFAEFCAAYRLHRQNNVCHVCKQKGHYLSKCPDKNAKEKALQKQRRKLEKRTKSHLDAKESVKNLKTQLENAKELVKETEHAYWDAYKRCGEFGGV